MYMKRIKDEVYGNSCIYFIHNVFNLFLAIMGLVIVGFGAYAWMHFTGNIWIFGVSLIGIGTVEFLLAYTGWTSRRSNSKLLCYLYVLGALFIC